MNNVLIFVANLLVAIGAINWGLVALFGFNLVAIIFVMPLLVKIVYILVGLSGIYALVNMFKK